MQESSAMAGPAHKNPVHKPDGTTLTSGERAFLDSVPPGFTFFPSEEDLIFAYLMKKIQNAAEPYLSLIIDVDDVYSHPPEELYDMKLYGPAGNYVETGDYKYFFSRRRMHPNLNRRKIPGGEWRDYHEPDVEILINGTETTVGFSKSLSFSEGDKIYWMMFEYRVYDRTPHPTDPNLKQDDWVLCKLQHVEPSEKDRGPPNDYDEICLEVEETEITGPN